MVLKGVRRLSPFFIPMIIPDMASGVLSIRYTFRGPNHCVVSACATGNHSLADLERPRPPPARVTISNAFGFGGHNTCAVFRAWEGR